MQDLAKSYITLRGKVFGATMATKVSYWLTTTPRLVESGPLTHGSTPGRREHGSGHLVGSPAVWTIGHFVTTRGSLRWMLGFLSFLAWTGFLGLELPFGISVPGICCGAWYSPSVKYPPPQVRAPRFTQGMRTRYHKAPCINVTVRGWTAKQCCKYLSSWCLKPQKQETFRYNCFLLLKWLLFWLVIFCACWLVNHKKHETYWGCIHFFSWNPAVQNLFIGIQEFRDRKFSLSQSIGIQDLCETGESVWQPHISIYIYIYIYTYDLLMSCRALKTTKQFLTCRFPFVWFANSSTPTATMTVVLMIARSHF